MQEHVLSLSIPKFSRFSSSQSFSPLGQSRRRESSPWGADGVEDLTRALCTRNRGCGRRGPTGRASGLVGVFNGLEAYPAPRVAAAASEHSTSRGRASG